MSTKSRPQPIDKNHGQDLAAFERMPEATKELLKLKDQAEKVTGPERVVITQKIKDKARKPRP